MNAYKVFTHDLRPPIQGGDPVIKASLPVQLPRVPVDTSDAECGAGWNACADAATALRIGGLWPDGRPSRVFEVRAEDEIVLRRGDKLRAPTWTVTRELTDAEVAAAITAMSQSFGDLADEMAREQIAWRRALARPQHDDSRVEAELHAALRSRGLSGWSLSRFASAQDAWAAWAAQDARAARDPWAADAGDAWTAWTVRTASVWNEQAMRAEQAMWAEQDAWAAWAAWDAWAAWVAWNAGDARAAWDARAARDALTVYFAARRGWVNCSPDLLTAGLRDAYAHGLALAIPIGPNKLGWAMTAEGDAP